MIHYHDRRTARCPLPDAGGHCGTGSLTQHINGGSIDTLLILGGNPVYNAPADVEFGESLKKVKNSVHLGLHDDETSRLCTWHLSRAHYLESWGDARTCDGTVSIVQPLIEPLFDGRSAIEVLAMISGDKAGIDGGGYEIVRRTFRSLPGRSFSEWKWKKALADGVVEGTAWESDKSEAAIKRPPVPEMPIIGEIDGLPPLAKGEYEVVFFPRTARSTTAGLPTTAGCRKCRTR